MWRIHIEMNFRSFHFIENKLISIPEGFTTTFKTLQNFQRPTDTFNCKRKYLVYNETGLDPVKHSF